MTFYQLAFRYLKRKKAKTILLFLVLLLVCSMILSTNMILRATEDSKDAIQEKTKAKIVLEISKEEDKITQQEIEKISRLKEVSALNRLDKTYAFPFDFCPVTYSDSTEERNRKITLLSYDDLQNDSAFSEEKYRLTDGDYITKDKKGVVINSLLADFNGLKLGDFIELENDNGEKISVPIIGIFLSGSERKQTEETASVNRIENQLFIDNESYSKFWKNAEYYKVSVYSKNPKQLSALEKELRLIFPENISFTSSDTLYRQTALPLEQIADVAKIMFVLTLVTGILIVSLLLCMWTRARQKEFAVFISMGKSKRSIFLQALSESFSVFIVAITGACGLGSIAAKFLQKVLTNFKETNVSLSVFLQGKDVGSLIVWGGMIVLISVTISLFPILRAKPKDTLSRMEG